MKQDEFYIKLALELAAKGRGRVSPNPLVGCVLVKNEKIIGAGFHEFFGGPHAEVNAINSASENVEGATLYVNLEPCSHFGKTPPCSDLIIDKKIKQVVVGTLDNNPLVAGNGIKKLVHNGVKAKVGVLEKECMELNRFFFKYIQKKIPYVTAKIAQTLDGKIADKNNNSHWITTKYSRTEVHRLRAEYDAVLVGINTVLVDNPELTVRHIEGRNPLRVVLDSKLRIPLDKNIISSNKEHNTCIITSTESRSKTRKIKQLQSAGVEVIFLPRSENGSISLKESLKTLAKKGIMSVLVEGGSRVFSLFLKEKLVDEMRVFINPKILGGGLPAIEGIGVGQINQADKWKIKTIERYGDDIMLDLRRSEI